MLEERAIESLKTHLRLTGSLERTRMVYCAKCGTKNSDDATVCSSCGATLHTIGGRPEYYRRMENECFGIPRGGMIIALAIGIIILLAGTIAILQQAELIPKSVEVWPFAIIIFGILIIVSTLYSRRR